MDSKMKEGLNLLKWSIKSITKWIEFWLTAVVLAADLLKPRIHKR